VASAYSYFAGDGDGTDSISLNIFGVGTPDSVANREQLRMGWFPASDAFLIYTEAQGTGVLRNLSLGTEGNTDTLKILTDGNVDISNDLNVGGTTTLNNITMSNDGTTLSWNSTMNTTTNVLSFTWIIDSGRVD